MISDEIGFASSIDEIVLHDCRLAMNRPVLGARQHHVSREVLIVELKCNGISGFGEVSTLGLPSYSPEWTSGSKRLLEEILIPDLLRIGSISFDSLDWLVGNGASRFGLESALADLLAKSSGLGMVQFLSELFSSDQYLVEKRSFFGATVGALSGWENAISEAKCLTSMGATRIKIKVDPNSIRVAPWRSLANLDAELIFDFNGSIPRTQLDILNQFPSEYQIEEPSSQIALVEFGTLYEPWANRIVLDESANSLGMIQLLHQLNSEFSFVVKPFRIGSLIVMNDLCCYLGSENIGCYLGGMFETSIGRRMLLSLSTHSCFSATGDMGPSSWYYLNDVGNAVNPVGEETYLSGDFALGIDVDQLDNHICGEDCRVFR